MSPVHAIIVELRRDAGRIGPSTGPWIRRRQISQIHGAPDPRALARITDKRGETLGWGLVSEHSDITVRVLAFGDASPPPDWLASRLRGALSARLPLAFEAEGTTGYREVNSEGDGLPGLVVDRYEEDRVVQVTTAPMAVRAPEIRELLAQVDDRRVRFVVPRTALRHEGMLDPSLEEAEGPERMTFHEHGVRFEVPAPPTQKTGAYFDQRDNRRFVADLAARTSGPLLDVGCHVGGFALHAALRGVPVVAVDQSERALAMARENADRSGADAIRWVAADMFTRWDDPALQGPFGTIVLDPPKIASRKSDLDRALSALAKLAHQAGQRLRIGGHLVLCSCSHHIGQDALDRTMAELPSGWARVRWLGAGLDHPVAPGHREGDYLRVGVYQRRR